MATVAAEPPLLFPRNTQLSSLFTSTTTTTTTNNSSSSHLKHDVVLSLFNLVTFLPQSHHNVHHRARGLRFLDPSSSDSLGNRSHSWSLLKHLDVHW
ncbi:hypothetical protein Q3G72_023239 [Acer saccharum]|nr:hypothetical protein Q3G72_023239 [Acer saccharum]